MKSNMEPNTEIGYAKVPISNPRPDRPVVLETGGTKWELAYTRPGYGLQPLLNASRDLRVEGLELVPEIVNELQDEAEQRINIMREAKKLASEM